MAYDGNHHGYAIVHSVPKYPSTSQDGEFLPTIDDSQKKNGQHLFCMTVQDSDTVEKLKENGCFISPNIYHPSSSRDICRSFSNKDGNFCYMQAHLNKWNTILEIPKLEPFTKMVKTLMLISLLILKE